jgi:hypothetical protein
MLFDLDTDPDELNDLARGAGYEDQIARLKGMLAAWGLRLSQRVTKSDADIAAMRGRSMRRGVLPFLYDGTEVPAELVEKYQGRAEADYTGGGDE